MSRVSAIAKAPGVAGHRRRGRSAVPVGGRGRSSRRGRNSAPEPGRLESDLDRLRQHGQVAELAVGERRPETALVCHRRGERTMADPAGVIATSHIVIADPDLVAAGGDEPGEVTSSSASEVSASASGPSSSRSSAPAKPPAAAASTIRLTSR